MKNIDKKSLLIAPMAIMIFGGSLSSKTIKADEANWSQQEQQKNDKQRINDFKNKYNDASLEILASQYEQVLSNQVNKSINGINDRYSRLKSQIDSINKDKYFFENFDSNTENRDDMNELSNKVYSINIYYLSGTMKKVDSLKNYINNIMVHSNLNKQQIEYSKKGALDICNEVLNNLESEYNDNTLRNNIIKLQN
ncbi:hypothetical protein FD06_GL000729 [Apilactobacillus ozensis DSM 23829 = JCM 17196]|uniref:Uncharacterized protein n=1 Tax=Apilactobacillus ozensis DSM 23829 = JCM 17196 TaxID=1423781 RepID=A0A0R2ALJ1_9LACO|nr:hypothetical protein [Apilactobacillus ozensis]KRM67578.1 hypothetical protein FD06_GL000729 [Apilactobacillus ozensis DSM 23829 = JCM 17196]